MKVKIVIVALVAITALLSVNAEEGGMRYEPNWASLDTRPTPQWWVDAKFGIFVHRGPYSVPAYSPMSGKDGYANYAEWYAGQLMRTNAEVITYHKRMYGNLPYANLAAQFKAENFNPAKRAALFRKAGARYAVLTSMRKEGLKCGFYYSLLEHGNACCPLKVRYVPAWGKDALPMKEWARTMNIPS